MPRNVFKQYYCPWRYPSNWWNNIRLFFRRYKWAYQRASRGYADSDVWDLDAFYLNLFHDTLNHLAEHHHGYPGTEEFPTDEKWTAYLKEMAQLFYQANENNEAFPHPEEEKWWAWEQEHPDYSERFLNADWTDKNPHSAAMLEESKDLSKKQDAAFHKAWDMMGKVMFHLWD